MIFTCTVREFLAEHLDERCDRVTIVSENRVDAFDRDGMNDIPESLLDAEVKDYGTQHDVRSMTHQLMIRI